MDGSGESRPAAADWAAVKAMYADRTVILKDIAAKHGIPEPRICERARREGWPGRNFAASPVNRLRALAQRRLGGLEAAMGGRAGEATAAENERDIRAISLLAGTLDKLLELERKHRATKSKRRSGVRAVDDARRLELARRLDALCQEPVAPGDLQSAERGGD